MQEFFEVSSPEMMIKQAVLKEFLNQKQRVDIADGKKKTRLTIHWKENKSIQYVWETDGWSAWNLW